MVPVSNLIPFAVIATASKQVRDEIGPLGWFTALPAFSQPGLATVVLADQARRAVSKRTQVATAAVTAAYDAGTEGTSLAEQFSRHPALKDIDADAIEQAVTDRAQTATGTTGAGYDAALVAAGRMVKAALAKNKGGQFSEAEAEEFREFLHHLRLAASDLVDLLVTQPAPQVS